MGLVAQLCLTQTAEHLLDKWGKWDVGHRILQCHKMQSRSLRERGLRAASPPSLLPLRPAPVPSHLRALQGNRGGSGHMARSPWSCGTQREVTAAPQQWYCCCAWLIEPTVSVREHVYLFLSLRHQIQRISWCLWGSVCGVLH